MSVIKYNFFILYYMLIGFFWLIFICNILTTIVKYISGTNLFFHQGLSAGRCEVQAVSPVTGRVMGAREVRVAADRVAIAGLRANVVSGLQLRVSAASDSGNSKQHTMTFYVYLLLLFY